MFLLDIFFWSSRLRCFCFFFLFFGFSWFPFIGGNLIQSVSDIKCRHLFQPEFKLWFTTLWESNIIPFVRINSCLLDRSFSVYMFTYSLDFFGKFQKNYVIGGSISLAPYLPCGTTKTYHKIEPNKTKTICHPLENHSRMTILEAFKLLFNQFEKTKYLFHPSLIINPDHDKWITRSTNCEIFATFPLKRTLFRCKQIHHAIVNQIKCDAFLHLFLLETELETKKTFINSSPQPIAFHFIQLKIDL